MIYSWIKSLLPLCKVLLFIAFMTHGYSVNASKIDVLKTEIQKSTNVDEKLRKMIDLAKVYKYVNIDSSLYFCDKAYPMTLSDKNINYEIEILTLKSELSRKKGDYDKAMNFATLARDKSIMADSKKLHANVLLSLGGVYFDLGAFDLAYENCMTSLEIFKSLNDEEGAFWCHNTFGILLSFQKQMKESLEYFNMAEKAAIALNDNVLMAAIFNNLGLYHLNTGNLKMAEAYIHKSLKICEDERFTMMIIYNYANLAILYAMNNDYDKAIKTWLTIESIAMSAGSKYELAKSRYSLAWIYYQTGDKSKALDYFHQSYATSIEIGSVEMAKINLDYLSKIYYELGDLNQAYGYSVDYNKFTDSLNMLNNANSMMRLKYEYDYQRDKESLIWQNRVRNIIIAVLFIVLFFIVFSVIVMKKRHKLKIKNMELSRAQLEIELEHKSREMTTKLIYLQKKNDMIASIVDQLLKLKPQMKIQNQEVIDGVINTLKNNTEGDNWKEFELRFEEIHSGFMKKLNERFPDLTQNEKRLCAYLRLNMTTKEIASLLYLSIHSVDSARYRLRKKLNLTNSDIDISAFLEQF